MQDTNRSHWDPQLERSLWLCVCVMQKNQTSFRQSRKIGESQRNGLVGTYREYDGLELSSTGLA